MEAHRSQYDFIDGFAKHLRDAFANATFIGFTGTPIETTDRNTKPFSVTMWTLYDIQQTVNDKTTVPIFYRKPFGKKSILKKMKSNHWRAVWRANRRKELSNHKQMQAKWTRLETIVGNPNRLQKIAEDLVYHFEQRNAVLEGKAMIVLYEPQICVGTLWCHHQNPSFAGIQMMTTKAPIKVIMTGSSRWCLEYATAYSQQTEKKSCWWSFEKSNDPLNWFIVRDMWLRVWRTLFAYAVCGQANAWTQPNASHSKG